MVVFGQSGYIRSKVVVLRIVVVFGQRLFYFGNVVVVGRSGCIWAKVVVVGKIGCIWAKWL